jgi:hypothetical protein
MKSIPSKLGALAASAVTLTALTPVFINASPPSQQTLPEQRVSSSSPTLAKSAGKTVNFSSGEGTATASVSWLSDKQFRYTINLSSRKGNPVYVEYVGVRDFFPDTSSRRLTGDTRSRATSSGTSNIQKLKLSGVKFRICKNVPFRPDPCGSYSRVVRR